MATDAKKKATLRMTNGAYIELIDTAEEIDRIVVEGIVSSDRGWIHFEQKDVWVNRGQINVVEVKSGD